MKPITDEMVHSLIRGMAAREKDEIARRAAEVRGSGIQARVIRFARAVRPSAEVVSLDAVRKAAGARRTVRGIFCYAPRL